MGTQIPQGLEKVYDASLFEGLSAAQVEGVLPCILATVRYYGPRERVLRESGADGSVGIVLDGALSVCGPGRTPLGSLGRGDLFGETALCGASARGQRVVAETPSRVLHLSGDFFLARCGKECANKETHQQIVRNMLRLLSERAVAMSRKIAYLAAGDLKTKIAMYLCELHEQARSETFVMPLNRDRLAAFFSVARPSLSRELAGLKSQGVVDYYRSSVTILDLPALYRIAAGD